MEAARCSRTAEAAAAVRAAHLLYDRPVIFADPFAVELISRAWRVVVGNRLLHWLILKRILKTLHRPMQAQILARSCFAENCLEEAIALGVDQYVIVSAGLDSFALRRRDLAERMKVYELDHPASQEVKRERLAAIHARLPKTLEFVPIDLEKGTVAEALGSSSFSPRRPAFLSWLGTTGYLTQEAIFGTLRSIASFCARGTIIVFDYRIAKQFLAPTDVIVFEAAEKFARRRGEPIMPGLDPGSFPQEVCTLGFECLDNLPPQECQERYFANRNDDLRAFGGSYLARFRVVSQPNGS